MEAGNFVLLWIHFLWIILAIKFVLTIPIIKQQNIFSITEKKLLNNTKENVERVWNKISKWVCDEVFGLYNCLVF